MKDMNLFEFFVVKKMISETIKNRFIHIPGIVRII